MTTKSRQDLLLRLDETLRTIGARSVSMNDAVARHVGLNMTDLKCLELLIASGPATAGKLAAHTGLTTGAMTAVIDRLERAGYARRRRDADDRRCVLVEALARAHQNVEPLYRRLTTATSQLNEQFDERELTAVLNYLTGALDIVSGHISWLQTQQPASGPRRSATGEQGRARATRRTQSA